MRRKEREISNQTIIEEILKQSTICRIALNDGEFPYIVPLNYGYTNHTLYFHCATQGKKLDLIQKNNKVAFEIESGCEIIPHEESCKWTTKYRSIIGLGEIVILSDFEEKKKGLDVIMNHNGKEKNSYNEKAVNNILVLKLSIQQISAKQAGDW